LPANSALINAGSTTADLVGLYHFTTQTNQMKETNSPVDIGYHYVAVDGNGNPVDTDGDGIPDYIEDANGNGSYDAGDLSNFNSADTDGDGPSDYQEYQAGSDPQIGSMVIAWGDNSSGQCDVSSGLRDVVAVAGGNEHSLALKSDGTIIAWGNNTYDQTNVPAGLTNVASIAAGAFIRLLFARTAQ
jgi:Regulator of chromosome condensation (RCC1) repeat/Bacterial TSP3 repeat